MANDSPASPHGLIESSFPLPPEGAFLPEAGDAGTRPLEVEIHDDVMPVVIEEPIASQTVQDPDSSEPNIPTGVAQRLYISHFLSTWNSRSFEIAAVLFLASIFPMTLLPLSIYALVRSASAIIAAPTVGRTIDKKSRLPVVRFSIVGGRTSVIISCIGFWILNTYRSLSTSTRWAIFSLVTVLSCVEKPSSVLNLVAVERDWAVVIAGDNGPKLRTLNARMRRIDLFCKLAGPLFVALVDGSSTKVAIFWTLGTNLISIPIECFAIKQVYTAVPLLQAPKDAPSSIATPDISSQSRTRFSHLLPRWFHAYSGSLKFYYQHRAFLPSFALSLLYFTVLSLSGQMVTYLISAGYNSFHIALVRTLSTIFEISATWIAPRAMKRIGPPRAGMWFLSWQILWLGAAVTFFWAETAPIKAASGLVAGTILSRIGLWGYDLCAQFIVQEEVQGSHRGSFSSTEASFQNAFELLSYVSTMIWSRPNQFRYPVLLSAAAVYTAALLYGKFLRRRRGHLVHLTDCVKRRGPERVGGAV